MAAQRSQSSLCHHQFGFAASSPLRPSLCAAGATSEHPIKELKLGLQAKRLRCRRFVANQFRLLLTQAAYVLMLSLRQAATGTRLAQVQVERLRSTVIKIAARVRVSARRVLVELAAYVPFAPELRHVARHLMQAQPWVLS